MEYPLDETLMIVRYFWRECDFRNKKWGSDPIDAFWVEATLEEAEESVFLRMRSEAVIESEQLARRFEGVADEVGSPGRPFCFLVARDLSAIDPFCVHYPVHQLWNAYSPFEAMPKREIATLDELPGIILPPKT